MCVCVCVFVRQAGLRESNLTRGLHSVAAAEKRPSQGQDGCQMRLH